MFYKFLCVFVALVAVPQQTNAQLETIIQYLQLAQKAIDLYREYKESDDGIVSYIIQNVPEYDAVDEYIEYVLHNYSDSLREETVCLLRLFNEASPEDQEKIRLLVAEIVNWHDLRQLRDEELEYCDSLANENSGSLLQAAQQYCRLQVASSTSVEITQATLQIQMYVLELGSLWIDATQCVASLISSDDSSE